MDKMRRPTTGKHVLMALERGLEAVDHDSLDRFKRADHRRALKWLKGIRRFNLIRARERAEWESSRIRAERASGRK